jgi:hypothetical protein
MQFIPKLTFFCELPGEDLKKLFSTPGLIKQLQTLNANISMGIKDFSSERSSIVKQLTRSGIPVTAWLLLPEEKGYWTSLDTVSETVKCYCQFKEWTVQNRLHWAAVGLDIEPRKDRMELFGKHWYKSVPSLISRLFRTQKYSRLENDLRALINIIRSDGFAVETYNFPFSIDEKRADSRILTKALGTPPLDSDREVLMLYSSFFPSIGDAVLWSYAHQAEGIGIGSTGGGVELKSGEPLATLSWNDLRKDLLIAKSFSPNIYIFSLEGCVANDYLDRIIKLDWNGFIQIPEKKGKMISSLRSILQTFLWILSHPLGIIIPFLFIKQFSKKK